MIDILEDWCKGCEICIKRCPVQALELSTELNKRGVYPPKLKENNECTFCRLCELLCPDFVISVTREEVKEVDEPKSKLIIGGVCNDI
ncbi:MAG: 4Fe-4S binding protein [Thermoplasmata archaeon]|nr:4Fe-4S binding protein [Thermoplasmata archaeon]